jgi:hypothetical protein
MAVQPIGALLAALLCEALMAAVHIGALTVVLCTTEHMALPIVAQPMLMVVIIMVGIQQAQLLAPL